MQDWLWVSSAAVVAAVSVMASDLGVVVWQGLVTSGVLAEPICNDVVVIGAAPSEGLGACMRPVSMTVVALAVTLAVALAAAVCVHRAVRNRTTKH